MMMFRRLAALAALALLAACSGGAHGSSRVAAVGALAPAWKEPTSTHGDLSMAKLRGKPVYLNFFATWCPPCNEEAPEINMLQKRYAAQGLQVVGVDELEDKQKAEQFARKYGLVYPVVVDGGTLQGEYNVNGLPAHVFIDRTGVIRKIVAGEMSKSQIEAAIRSIL